MRASFGQLVAVLSAKQTFYAFSGQNISFYLTVQPLAVHHRFALSDDMALALHQHFAAGNV